MELYQTYPVIDTGGKHNVLPIDIYVYICIKNKIGSNKVQYNLSKPNHFKVLSKF